MRVSQTISLMSRPYMTLISNVPILYYTMIHNDNVYHCISTNTLKFEYKCSTDLIILKSMCDDISTILIN